MNKNRIVLYFSLPLLALVSCSPNTSSSASKIVEPWRWISPTGAPALTFYSQGNNANWISSSTPASDVVPSFRTNTFDAIVFDGIAGLSQIRASQGTSKYKLVRWINELPFYLVSVKHSSLEEYQAGQTIDAFVETGNASRALRVLAKEQWNWGDLTSISAETGSKSVTYEAGVAEVNAKLQANPQAYDYYVLAEPVFTSATAALKAKSITLNKVADLQVSWSQAYDGAKIPAAALFMNTDSIQRAKDEGRGTDGDEDNATAFLSMTDTHLLQLSNYQDIVGNTLSAYEEQHRGTDKDLAARFGVQPAIVQNLGNLQKTNKFGFLQSKDANGLGYFNPANNRDYANGFASHVGIPAFDASFFLSL